MREPPAAFPRASPQLLFLAFPAWNFLLQSLFGTPRQATIPCHSGGSLCCCAPRPLLPFPRAEQPAGLVRQNCIKVSPAVRPGGKPSRSPPPSTEEGRSPLTLLTGRGEVIRAVRGVAGIGAGGQQRSVQVHRAGAGPPAGPSAHAGCGSL